jgi:hypothetical protein
MKHGPFTIEASECWTECECPESLCKHESGMRPYNVWIIWDDHADEHASIVYRGRFADSYEKRRDAIAAVDSFLTGKP